MKARRRLEEILECAKKASDVIRDVCGSDVILADIGADHGWVSHFSHVRGIADACICTDISKSSLLKAEKLFDVNPDLKGKVDFRVGDGFEVFNNDLNKVDICVIAGMGVAEILKIIGENKKNAGGIRIFVLQARHDEYFAKVLAKYCGLEIIFDKVILDRKHVYRTIVAVDFANCTLQQACVCDKLRLAFDEANGTDIQNLGIDFEIFGKNNLFDSSKEHAKAIDVLLEQAKGLKSNLEANSKSLDDTDIQAFMQSLDSRIKNLKKIIAFLNVQ